jgi:dihydrofolate synthase/folylpolyglutamate synthase
VRFAERIRIAGKLVTDDALADTLTEVERVNAGAPITEFEVLMAVSFLLFARTRADLCVLEVGLGGRGDATNVIETAAAAAIASISMDHREFLGDTIEQIAAEKAGIMKPAVPAVTGAQPAEVLAVFDAHAAAVGTHVHARGRDWTIEPAGGGLLYADALGKIALPPPSLLGTHQYDNAGIAVATARASGLPIPKTALARGIATAEWPARLQRLHGKLAAMLPPNWELWLDGGHNPGAGVVLAEQLARWRDRPLHLIVGMKQAKDSSEFLRPLIRHAKTLWAIAEPGQHLAMPVEAIIAASGGIARAGPTATEAFTAIPTSGPPARVLICGSLYLAGEVLKLDGWSP